MNNYIKSIIISYIFSYYRETLVKKEEDYNVNWKSTLLKQSNYIKENSSYIF